jgi:hypothetical protein
LAEDTEALVWLRLIQESPPVDDPARGVVGLEDSYPGAGTLPISLWPAGVLLAGRQYIPVGADTPAPTVVRLDVALYDAATGRRYSHPGEDLPTIGRVKVVPRRWPRVGRGEALARFEPGVSLVAVDLGARVATGETLPLTLTWSVRSAPRRDYSVFLHLQDDQGVVRGYGDGAPRGGNYATFWWEADEVIVDERTLVIDADAPPGQYTVVAGLYGADGRVPAHGPDGVRFLHDAVVLDRVEVQ